MYSKSSKVRLKKVYWNNLEFFLGWLTLNRLFQVIFKGVFINFKDKKFCISMKF